MDVLPVSVDVPEFLAVQSGERHMVVHYTVSIVKSEAGDIALEFQKGGEVFYFHVLNGEMTYANFGGFPLRPQDIFDTLGIDFATMTQIALVISSLHQRMQELFLFLLQ